MRVDGGRLRSASRGRFLSPLSLRIPRSRYPIRLGDACPHQAHIIFMVLPKWCSEKRLMVAALCDRASVPVLAQASGPSTASTPGHYPGPPSRLQPGRSPRIPQRQAACVMMTPHRPVFAELLELRSGEVSGWMLPQLLRKTAHLFRPLLRFSAHTPLYCPRGSIRLATG